MVGCTCTYFDYRGYHIVVGTCRVFVSFILGVLITTSKGINNFLHLKAPLGKLPSIYIVGKVMKGVALAPFSNSVYA